MKKLLVALVMVVGLGLIYCAPSMAWNGYDYDRGNYVEIERGNLVREGQTIEYYDYSTGNYSTGDVTDITRYGSSVEVEVYDYDSGEYRTFDMDGN